MATSFALTQDTRMAQVTSPLGADVLLVTGGVITEQINRPFQIELDLLSETTDIAFTDIVGLPMTLSLTPYGNNVTRYFNGYVSRFVQTSTNQNAATYRATLVPWYWFLTRASDMKIFQAKSVTDILQAVFSGYGFTGFALNTIGSYDPFTYCVQYRETAFNFTSRLMEWAGIYYYFTHANGSHTMQILDDKSSHVACATDTLEFNPEQGRGAIESGYLREWTAQAEYHSGKYTLNDYAFQTPATSLLKSTSTVDQLSNLSSYEVYDYPADTVAVADGSAGAAQVNAQATIRMQELETPSRVYRGRTDDVGISVGGTFSVTKHPRSDFNDTFMVTQATHTFYQDDFTSQSRLAQRPLRSFSTSFTAIPQATQYRPPRVTPKPVVQGLQHAIVVGPSGEEIYCDKFGRIKVQFFWDRLGTNDENSSCWVRIAEQWAGTNWGTIHIPRVGQEVLVEFVEGDPDRPLVTGRVYNASLMPPYALPANMTQSGIKSRSTKGGSDSNYNEFRFEDKKGSEMVLLHAEKDQTIEVENNESHWVGNDRAKKVDHDETVTIGHNRSENVGNTETITIQSDRTENVGGTESVTVAKDRNVTIQGGDNLTISKDLTISVNQGETVSITKDRSITVGGGDTLSVGKDLSITATNSIVLTTGSAKLTMKSDGTISIEGKDITISGSGDVSAKASGNMTIKGSQTAIN